MKYTPQPAMGQTGSFKKRMDTPPKAKHPSFIWRYSFQLKSKYGALTAAADLQIFPFAVNFLLIQFDQMFIFLVEQVFETALRSQEIFDRQFVLGFIIQHPFAVDDFEQRPVACFYRCLTDIDDIRCIVSPASGAGSHDIQECCAFCINGFFCLQVQVSEILYECCLCNIG